MNTDLLKNLCLTGGISGDESLIREIIIKEISNCNAEYHTDKLGNLIVFKKGANRPKTRLMISAHMDEVGLIVTHVDDKGYIGFDKVGGIDNQILPGTNVFIGKNRCPGVIGLKPIHLTKKSELETLIDSSKLLIDIGAKNKEDALKYVNIGDSVIFDSIFNNTNNKIISKALDDRVGCFILVNMIKQELEYDMYFVFTVQEEIGLIGASVSSYTVNSQAAIIIESTTANDLPNISEYRKICSLGNGAVVSFMDKRTSYDKEYYDLAMSIAKQNNIKVQPKCGVTGGNDAGAISLSRGGVRVVALSVPCRYLHSPAGIVYESDIESTYKLALFLANKISST